MENYKKLHLFDLENKKDNYVIVGVDEAGRGPLAGNVIAAAVCVTNVCDNLAEINDSKKLTEKKRERLYEIIFENCIVGIGGASVEEIDEHNILNATFLAMNRAIDDIKTKIVNKNITVLVDGNHKIKWYEGEQKEIIKGDSKSLSIAAASIIAKVTRDRQLLELDKLYPEYFFKNHKGYGTKKHVEVILKRGYIEGVHRKTFLKKIL